MHSLVYYYHLVFGSDTQTGSSPAYVWLADQFGHLFIGFGGLFLILWTVATFTGRPVPGYALPSTRTDGKKTLSRGLIWTVAVVLLGIYIAKEMWDLAIAGGREGLWLENWDKDLWQDSLTDFLFVAIGLALALAHFGMFGVQPSLVFGLALVATIFLVGYWLPSFDKLGKTKVPLLARMSGVSLIPAAPMESIGSAPAETAAQGEQSACKPYMQVDESSQSEKPLQCVTRGDCTHKHFVIYGLTSQDLPKLEGRDSRISLQRSLAPYLQMAPQEQTKGRVSKEISDLAKKIKESINELRRLGAALPAEQVFRGGKGEIYFDTLYSFSEDNEDHQESSSTSEPTTLVLDNIEHDIMTFLSNREIPPEQIVSALEKLSGAKPGSLKEKLSGMTVVWLSFNERLAMNLCNALAQNAGPQGEVILIRAKLPEK